MKKKPLVFVICLFFLALLLPLSNLLPRNLLEVKKQDPGLRGVSAIMQQKCANCHTPELTDYPLYFNLPIAKQIIDNDILQARSHMVIEKKQLTGESEFTDAQLEKIRLVLTDGSMPPSKYIAMHWNAGLSSADKKVLRDWINLRPGGVGIKPIPLENPFKPDAAKVALGLRLYHDTRLSGDDTISCASCHGLDKGGTDQTVVSVGIRDQRGPINSPTVYNAAFNVAQFWDGRAKDLQEQAAGPVNNPVEMGSNWTQVIEKLRTDEKYVKSFEAIYGGIDPINSKNITDAIAEFEKSLLTPHSRFDKYLAGDKTALSVDEKKGYELFMANQCATCHTGVNLGSQTFEKMGLIEDYFALRGGTVTEADAGRFNVTKKAYDQYKFKVPTLRNVEVTQPYFHDGSAKTLHDAVKIMARVQTGRQLDETDIKYIVNFLKTLNGDTQDPPLKKAQ